MSMLPSETAPRSNNDQPSHPDWVRSISFPSWSDLNASSVEADYSINWAQTPLLLLNPADGSKPEEHFMVDLVAANERNVRYMNPKDANGNLHPDPSKIWITLKNFPQGTDPTHDREPRPDHQWHMDYVTERSMAGVGLLCCTKVPQDGAATEFINTTGYLSELSDARADELRRTVTTHRYADRFINGKEGAHVTDTLIRQHNESSPITRPLVAQDQDTGSEALLYARQSFVCAERDGADVTDEILEMVDSIPIDAPDQYFRVEWRVGEAAMWRNVGLLHRAVPVRGVREMGRTTSRIDPGLEDSYIIS